METNSLAYLVQLFLLSLLIEAREGGISWDIGSWQVISGHLNFQIAP
jgi:hypothetical protein